MASSYENTLPAPRPLNDFADVDPIMAATLQLEKSQTNAPDDGTQTQGADPLDAAEMRAQMYQSPEFQEELDRASNVIIAYFQTQLQQAAIKRDFINFSGRMIRNELRANNQVWVNVNATNGALLYGPNMMAGKRVASPDRVITQGWTASANRTASDYLYKRLFATGDDFFGWGDPNAKQEGRKISRAMTKVSRHQFRMGKFNVAAKDLAAEIFKNGTMFLRHRLVRKVELVKRAEGGYEEVRGEICPQFTPWPIEDVYLTNPEYPDAARQESVFWITRGTNVHKIEEDEATFDVLAGDGGNFMTRTAGRYANLNCLRDADANGAVSMAGTSMKNPAVGTVQSERKGDISSSPTFDLVEPESSVPIYQWIMDGSVTPRVLDYFGAEIGPAPPEGDRDALKYYARKASKLTHWEAAYPSYWLAGSPPEGSPSKNLLQFNPCPAKRPRNSLYIFKGYRDGWRAYGLSVADMGYRMEDAADILLNAGIWTEYFNAYPSTISDPNLFSTAEGNEVQRLLTPNASLWKRPGMKAADSFEVMQLPPNMTKLEYIRWLGLQFDTTVGVTQASKSGTGAKGTGTLGQLNAEQDSTTNNVDGVMFGVIAELDRLIIDNMESLQDAMTPPEFIDYMKMVGGQEAEGIDALLPSIEGLTNEYFITHPVAFGKDSQQLLSNIMAIYELTQPVDHATNGNAFTLQCYELAGLPSPQDIMNGTGEVLEPEDEQDQMRLGNYMKPNPAMIPKQLQLHIAVHTQELQMLASGAIPLPPMQAQIYMELLQRHLQEETIMMQNIQQAAMDAAGIGPSKPSDEGGDEGGSASPRDKQDGADAGTEMVPPAQMQEVA